MTQLRRGKYTLTPAGASCHRDNHKSCVKIRYFMTRYYISTLASALPRYLPLRWIGGQYQILSKPYRTSTLGDTEASIDEINPLVYIGFVGAMNTIDKNKKAGIYTQCKKCPYWRPIG